MPTVGLIVEGMYDEAAIPVLLKRCRGRVRVVTRKCKGSVAGRLAGIVAELERSYKLERVLIMCDADGQQPATLIETIKKRLAGPYGFPVIPIIVVQMLEAWLVADPVALERVVGIKSSFRNPERVRNPKSELQRLLSRRTAYTPEVARRLAEQVDLQLLERRCRQFSAFRKALVDP
jgi:hypothetical protein